MVMPIAIEVLRRTLSWKLYLNGLRILKITRIRIEITAYTDQCEDGIVNSMMINLSDVKADTENDIED